MPAYKGQHEDVLLPFFDAMRHKLAASKYAGKKRWEETPLDQLLALLKAEIAELEEAIAGRNQIEILLEAADIGNYAMMVATVAIRQMSNGSAAEPHQTVVMWRCPTHGLIPEASVCNIRNTGRGVICMVTDCGMSCGHPVVRENS